MEIAMNLFVLRIATQLLMRKVTTCIDMAKPCKNNEIAQ